MDKDAFLQEQAPVKKSIWKRGWVVFAIVMLLLVSAAGWSVYYGYRMLQPMPAGESVRLTIQPGAAPSEIAQLLKEQGVVRADWAFVGYLKYKKQGSRFQAGAYEFTPGMTLDEIIGKLNRGDVVKEDMLRFTIPEGYTVAQIADKLSQEKVVDRSSFLKLADTDLALPARWSGIIPNDPLLKHRLEGYLFPETYEMKKDSTEQDVLNRLMNEWDNKLKLLPEGWEGQMDKRGLSFHQVLTVASLVEREVAVDDERPLVAGIIYNRIKQKMPLQIDATVQYLFEKQKERLLEKDLQLESPYNTYLHPGLPPGPIASPGLPSLRAALWPEESNYLFYVTKKDGSGRHLFAATFEEHKKNIAASKAP